MRCEKLLTRICSVNPGASVQPVIAISGGVETLAFQPDGERKMHYAPSKPPAYQARRKKPGATRMQISKLRLSVIAVASIGTFVLAAPAAAQLLDHKDLTASIAMTIVQTAIDSCKANGYAVSATVVGRNGEIIVQVRGDNTGPHTIENSFRKAYTARTFRSPSGTLVDRVKADPTLGLIHLTNVIANQGALPIKVGDEVIGAAGASGAPGGEKDEACVKAGIDKVADQLH
jgi:uncharacterized protein GlcG (DUF336 family)